MQFNQQHNSLIAAGVSDVLELRTLSQGPLLLFGKV